MTDKRQRRRREGLRERSWAQDEGWEGTLVVQKLALLGLLDLNGKSVRLVSVVRYLDRWVLWSLAEEKVVEEMPSSMVSWRWS